MIDELPKDRRLAIRGAFAAAALFVALIVAFSAAGVAQPTGRNLFLISLFGVASHLGLLPVVADLAAPAWARASGYGWVSIDVMLNVATLNGAESSLISALRLGGHLPAAVWLAAASWRASGSVRPVGLALALMLGLHAFASPWIPSWVIFIPFVLIPVWLTLVGFRLRRLPAGPVSGAVQ